MEWFLLRRFVDPLRACSLKIISRNHTNMFLLINLQKTITCPKQIIAARPFQVVRNKVLRLTLKKPGIKKEDEKWFKLSKNQGL